ncbi:nidogen-like domain-containing protein [Agitococcus lubricus]|uniref:Hemolysin type calcium-binding protein n=1 Tax=Agitococcus lubricus TaxID=1077255 RepID=A0A2T5IYF3_9GAMM|nr:nidogen-like domain-containing protein [Agitococcus lubricus]PTQ89028.1 hemolysin type calcium-binding protein [Agitococcus lubricus]
MTTVTNYSPTGYLIDGILMGASYQTPTNGKLSLTFSFPDYSSMAIVDNGNQLRTASAIYQQVIRDQLNNLERYVNIDFVEITGGEVADFNFSVTAEPISNASAYAFFPGDTPKRIILSADYTPDNSGSFMSHYGYMTLIHEMGHALGLKHPHNSFGYPDDGSNVFPLLDGTYDSTRYTVMSYNNTETVGDNIFSQTYSVFDVAALQYLYGANSDYNHTNTIYQYNLDTSYYFETLWDGGGIDTVTLNTAQNTNFDIRSGAINAKNGSYIISIAYDANIENLISGSGNDVLSGNELNNLIQGLDGADYIFGNEGNDTLDGGIGIDTLEGGVGDDSLMGGAGDDILKDVTANDTNDDNSVSVLGQQYLNLSSNQLVNGLGGNAGFGEQILLVNDDDSSDVIDISTIFGTAGLNFFGQSYTNLYVNNNGNITFGSPLSDYTPDPIGSNLDYPIIAGFWADVDTRGATGNISGGGNSLGTNRVYYDIDATNGVLTATWDDVGYFSSHSDKVNAFQIQLIKRGNQGDFDIIYRYEAVNWTTGDASAGSNGLGGVVARIGYSAGNGISYELPLSGNQQQVLDIDQNIGNSGRTGIYIFNVRNGVVTAEGGNDTLDGGIGADTMAGGIGNDTYIVGNINDVVIEEANKGYDTVKSTISYTIGINIESLLLVGDNNISGIGNNEDNLLTGNNGNNFISALAGNDTLEGGAGIDTLVGGLGNDTYIVDSMTDVINEAVNAGTDTIKSSVSFSLVNISNVENLTLIGLTDISATGNSLNNLIVGNDANNTLEGGAGIDTLIGGLGNDTYMYDGDVVVESTNAGIDTLVSNTNLTLNIANVENITLIGIAVSATGNEINNVLTGNDNDNILDGQLGSDTLIGGLGNDSYYIDSTGDVVLEQANEGTDTVISSIAITALFDNIENVTLTGVTANNVVANSLNNLVIGNSINNRLDGGLGADTLMAGVGSDTYIVDNLGDVVVEHDGEGTDQVISSVSFVLGSNLEHLRLTGNQNINATGNDLYNSITGNDANNIIDGGAGIDTMFGYKGDDTFIVDTDQDSVNEYANEGIDTIITNVNLIGSLAANIENLVLTGQGAINGVGNTLNNIITGNASSNILNGGTGIDTLIGGDGDDTYIVDNISDTIIEGENGGFDTLQSAISMVLPSYVEFLSLSGNTAINATGNEFDNYLSGNSANNRLSAGGGNDTLVGAGGTDTLIGGTGYDTYIVDTTTDIITELQNEGIDVVQSSVSYSLGNHLENLLLTGSSSINATGNELNNQLSGNAGANILNGGLGDDTLVGGAGNDTYIIDNVNDVILENVGAGTDTIQSAINYSVSANVENLTLIGTALNATGNSLNNILTGNSSHNTLDGREGVDTLVGGVGDDTYIVDDSDDVVTESASAGTDSVQSTVSYILSTNVENLVLVGTLEIDGTGNASNNVLTGNAADNTLNGGTGADSLVGGLGDDTYIVDNTGDVVTEQVNEGIDSVQSSVSYSLSAQIENLTLTGSSALNGTGNQLANLLMGNTGANILDGGVGADTLVGGAGNDSYLVDDTNDVVTELLNGGTADIVKSSVNYILSDYIEQLQLLGSQALSGMGNSLNNTLTGNSANNSLDGGAGVDTLVGGLGDDSYFVDSSTDVITENVNEGTDTAYASVNYTLSTHVENLVLVGTLEIDGTGNASNNVLTGNAADNTLNGGTGADSLVGGLGDDTYIVDNTGDVVTEQVNEGIDSVQSSVSYSLSAQVENLTLTGSSALNGTGNQLANLLMGNTGANILDGGAGADTLVGGSGVDTLKGGQDDDIYIIDAATEVIVELTDEGIDTVQSSVTYSLGANLENLLLLGSSAINATGNALNNTLTGNSANNTLQGGDGIDTLIGGLGNDVYIVDSTTDNIIELANEGQDTIQTSVSFVLSALNIETLVLTGSAAIDATGNQDANILNGNTANNTLQGQAGNDTLNGGAGLDTLIGGLGDDTYIVDSATDNISELVSEGLDTVQSSVTYSLGVALESLVLTGTSAINGTGNSSDNLITGNTAKNLLTGLEGNDTLNGGAGIDTLIGGLGNDVYVIDNIADSITENNDEGIDSIQSTVSYTLAANVEHLSLLGTAAINGTANTLNNQLTGNTANNQLNGLEGDDTLVGGGGVDTLVGGLGDDSYIIDNVNTVITELANEGIDTVVSSVNFTLAPNVEKISLIGAATTATGNDLNNTLIGNELDNVLDGAAGADTLIGGLGNDIYVIDSAQDIITELANQGNDTVQSYYSYSLRANLESLTLIGTEAINAIGNSYNNILTGNIANNILTGGIGNDTLDGGQGFDTLVGGVGNDIYLVDSSTDTLTEFSAEGVDTVKSTISYTLAANIERLELLGEAEIDGIGNSSNNLLTGNSTNNTLSGLAGNDTLDGGVGLDTLIGGTGDDTYYVDSILDIITELSGQGNDMVYSSVSYQLADNIEKIKLLGSENLNVIGNSSSNAIYGNAGANQIAGAGGFDTLRGGLGNDIYIVDVLNTTVVEDTNSGFDTVKSSVNYTLTASVERLELTGENSINGTGNSSSNYLLGNASNNTLRGAAGNDTIDGGAGIDVASYEYAANAVTVNLMTGRSSGADGADTLLNIENITGSAYNDVLTGNEYNNFIIGNAGNDTLTGGLGNDTLSGRTGNDTYAFSRGDAVDSIFDTDAAVGNQDTILFKTGIATTQLWFKHVGNNLELSIIGTTDKLIVRDWYLSTNNHIELFKLTDNNKTLSDTNVENLVTAMASMSPPPVGTTTLDSSQYASVLSVIAANWS